MTEKTPAEEIRAEAEPTELLYYHRPEESRFSAKVLRIDGSKVMLDRTLFYPEGGGQAADTGAINGCRVYDVKKAGKVVVHFLDKVNFREGDTVSGEIDWPVRKQHMQHHTGIHIINAVARSVLGSHVWQSGSAKGREKAHLDITHFQALDDDEVERIEKLANDAVRSNMRVNVKIMARTDAEKAYGMRIYQGGVVPERELRIIEIPEFDAEACGGTHCSRTGEIGKIIITSTERIQDGVVRINIVAGGRAEEYLEEKRQLMKEIESILGVEGEETIEAAQKLFDEWKKSRKERKTEAEADVEELAEELRGQFAGNVLVAKVDGDMEKLQAVSRMLSGDDRTIVLFGMNGKVTVLVSSGKNAQGDASKMAKEICEKLGGKGGGTPLLAQGFGVEKEKVDELIKQLRYDLNG